MSAVEDLDQERRITFCLYEFWEKLAGDAGLPALKNMSREQIAPFKNYLTLLDLRESVTQPTFQVVGQALQEDLDDDLTNKPVSAVPRRTMISRVVDHYQEVLANRVPIAFEAEFVNSDGEKALYRGILLPFSDDNENINFILGGVRWILEKDLTLDETKPTIEELMTNIAARNQHPEHQEADIAATHNYEVTDVSESDSEGIISFEDDSTEEIADNVSGEAFDETVDEITLDESDISYGGDDAIIAETDAAEKATTNDNALTEDSLSEEVDAQGMTALADEPELPVDDVLSVDIPAEEEVAFDKALPDDVENILSDTATDDADEPVLTKKDFLPEMEDETAEETSPLTTNVSNTDAEDEMSEAERMASEILDSLGAPDATEDETKEEATDLSDELSDNDAEISDNGQALKEPVDEPPLSFQEIVQNQIELTAEEEAEASSEQEDTALLDSLDSTVPLEDTITEQTADNPHIESVFEDHSSEEVMLVDDAESTPETDLSMEVIEEQEAEENLGEALQAPDDDKLTDRVEITDEPETTDIADDDSVPEQASPTDHSDEDNDLSIEQLMESIIADRKFDASYMREEKAKQSFDVSQTAPEDEPDQTSEMFSEEEDHGAETAQIDNGLDAEFPEEGEDASDANDLQSSDLNINEIVLEDEPLDLTETEDDDTEADDIIYLDEPVAEEREPDSPEVVDSPDNAQNEAPGISLEDVYDETVATETEVPSEKTADAHDESDLLVPEEPVEQLEMKDEQSSDLTEDGFAQDEDSLDHSETDFDDVPSEKIAIAEDPAPEEIGESDPIIRASNSFISEEARLAQNDILDDIEPTDTKVHETDENPASEQDHTVAEPQAIETGFGEAIPEFLTQKDPFGETDEIDPTAPADHGALEETDEPEVFDLSEIVEDTESENNEAGAASEADAETDDLDLVEEIDLVEKDEEFLVEEDGSSDDLTAFVEALEDESGESSQSKDPQQSDTLEIAEEGHDLDQQTAPEEEPPLQNVAALDSASVDEPDDDESTGEAQEELSRGTSETAENEEVTNTSSDDSATQPSTPERKKRGSVIERAMAFINPSFGQKPFVKEEPQLTKGTVDPIEDKGANSDAEISANITNEEPFEPKVTETTNDAVEDHEVENGVVESTALEQSEPVSDEDTDTNDTDVSIEARDQDVDEPEGVRTDEEDSFITGSQPSEINIEDDNPAEKEDLEVSVDLPEPQIAAEEVDDVGSLNITIDELPRSEAAEENTFETTVQEDDATDDVNDDILVDSQEDSSYEDQILDEFTADMAVEPAAPQNDPGEQQQDELVAALNEPTDVDAIVALDEDEDEPVDELTLAALKSTLKQIVGYIKKEDANHNRSRDSLYNILTAIYEFHATCETSPNAYDELLQEHDLKVQSRAPFTPILKICLGKDYDKTRLTEYAAALGIARYMNIDIDEFHAFIKNFPGGIKGCVKEMRVIRKHGASGNITARKTRSIEEAREILREMAPIASFRLKKVIVGNNIDEFCLLLAKRDGHDINVIKILDDKYTKLDPVLKRAAFIKGNLNDRK